MANRSIRGRRIIHDSSSDGDSNSDDDFPDLKDIAKLKAPKFATAKNVGKPISKAEPPAAKSVRRRKLGVIPDNPLLRPFGDTNSSTPDKKDEAPDKKKSTTPQRVELRTRKTGPVFTSVEVGEDSEAESVTEETIVEDFSGSDFDASESSDEESDDDSTFGEVLQRSPSKNRGLSNDVKGGRMHRERKRSPSPSSQLLAEARQAEERHESQRSDGSSRGSTEGKASKKKIERTRCPSTDDLADPLGRIQM